MKTYLQQLDEKAASLGIDLLTVCRAENVADTTLMRWRKGQATVREATAEKLFNRMDAMSQENAA
jgi:hypothetical protein